MHPQMLLIPAMMITVYCHTPKNNSDVIVTYSGHAEAINPAPILVPIPTTQKPETITTIGESEYKKEYEKYTQLPSQTETTLDFGGETESVVFIPNDNVVRRNRVVDYFETDTDDDRMSIKSIMSRGGGRSISDILNDKKIRVETEPPSKDILFISGKNNEEEENFTPKKKKEPSGRRRSGKMDEKKSTTRLDCSNLDCNTTLKSVCAGKMEHRRWRYRLFLNDCFFRKVNCNFKYEENRFKVFPLETCKNVAGHYSERPFIYKPSVLPENRPQALPHYRRSSSSRRSLNINVDGQFCSHPCPSSCPDQYEPECAVSNRGLRRVFVNHCKLDHNSCSYGTVWHRRPLSECVGGKKADMTRNSAFIGWMQRVGIVDNKGRLNLE